MQVKEESPDDTDWGWRILVQELEEPGADCHGYAHNDALAHTCNHSNVQQIKHGFSPYKFNYDT